jgi:hypothetical protein
MWVRFLLLLLINENDLLHIDREDATNDFEGYAQYVSSPFKAYNKVLKLNQIFTKFFFFTEKSTSVSRFASFFFFNSVYFKKTVLFFSILSLKHNHFFQPFSTFMELLNLLQLNNFFFFNKSLELKKKYSFFASYLSPERCSFSFNTLPLLRPKKVSFLKPDFFFLKINYSKIINLISSYRIKIPKRFEYLKPYNFKIYFKRGKFFEPVNFQKKNFLFENCITLIIKLKLFLKKYFKYSSVVDVFFRETPQLSKKYRQVVFSKHSLGASDMKTTDTLTINKSRFTFNKLEFFFLKKTLNFFLITSNLLFKPKIKNKKIKASDFILNDLQSDISLQKTQAAPLKKSHFFFAVNDLLSLFYNPSLFKFFYLYSVIPFKNTNSFSFNMFSSHVKHLFFYSSRNNFFLNNINKANSFSFILKKKIIKTFSYKKFDTSFTPTYTNSLVRFLEHCTGKKVLLKFFFFIQNFLTLFERTRCIIWAQKLQNFQKTIGHGFFLTESIQVIYLAIKIKDPYFFINWMRDVFNKISFWKSKSFFHYLKYLFKYFFWSVFSELKIKGLKFKLKGKVSVSGNARTRSVTYQIGHVSHSTYDNKILHAFDLVKTFTGVMGLQIWMVF